MAVAGATLYSCTGGNPIPKLTSPVTKIDTHWPIKRVVYLMLENRSYDNLFGRFPGANGATTGNMGGKEIPLKHSPQWLPGDLQHDYVSAVACLNGGSFGDYGDGYIRFSYANSLANLMEAVERIRKVSARWESTAASRR